MIQYATITFHNKRGFGAPFLGLTLQSSRGYSILEYWCYFTFARKLKINLPVEKIGQYHTMGLVSLRLCGFILS